MNAYLVNIGHSHHEVVGDGVPASCSILPTSLNFTDQLTTLPDPFHSLDGKRVHNKADWACRAEQIRELFQKYELGDKPDRPAVLSSTFSNVTRTLTITAGTSQSKTIKINVGVTYPTSGTAPYPAIIAYDSLPVPQPAGVAILTLPVSSIGVQDSAASRGKGLFYDLYGTNATAGALMAWAWSVSRVIDVLTDSPIRIDPKRIAVSGCSRNGKGALVAGAFDERVALTLPIESGSGGDACWRTSRYMLVNESISTQDSSEIVGENVWFSTAFNQFAPTTQIGKLPVDHHELAGLVAPRGLYSTGNIGYTWLGDFSSWECMKAANKIFRALGVQSNQGFAQDASHSHCSFPADQIAEFQLFVDKFLFGKKANTTVFRTAGDWTEEPSWTPWSVPRLT